MDARKMPFDEAAALDLGSIACGVDPALTGSAFLVAHPLPSDVRLWRKHVLGHWRWRPSQAKKQAGTYDDGGLYSAVVARQDCYRYVHELLSRIKRSPFLMVRIESQFVSHDHPGASIPPATVAGIWLGMLGIQGNASYEMPRPSAWRAQYDITGRRDAAKASAMRTAEALFGLDYALTEDDAEALLIAAIPPGLRLEKPAVVRRTRR